jgi:hypothetical protein
MLTITWRPLDESVGERCTECHAAWARWDRIFTGEYENPLLEGRVASSMCEECAKVMKDFEHDCEERRGRNGKLLS